MPVIYFQNLTAVSSLPLIGMHGDSTGTHVPQPRLATRQSKSEAQYGHL